jgi:RNA polymerase sigma-70 factor (ECF subfamily)
VDDAQLVAGAIAGRQECFETLVERHQRSVHALVYRWLGDRAVADEVVQATFVQAYMHLVDFRGDASFRSWLYGIALNQARTLQRDRRRERTIPIDDVAEGDLPQVQGASEGASEGGRLRDRLAGFIARLPPRQRAVVTLRVVGDLPFKEIAKLEGISENSAKVSYHHAVTRLRKWMGRG